jgi:hypothetical protein
MLQYCPGFCFAHPGYGSLGLRSERPLAIITPFLCCARRRSTIRPASNDQEVLAFMLD